MLSAFAQRKRNSNYSYNFMHQLVMQPQIIKKQNKDSLLPGSKLPSSSKNIQEQLQNKQSSQLITYPNWGLHNKSFKFSSTFSV